MISTRRGDSGKPFESAGQWLLRIDLPVSVSAARWRASLSSSLPWRNATMPRLLSWRAMSVGDLARTP
jgi:hypothetical protein